MHNLHDHRYYYVPNIQREFPYRNSYPEFPYSHPNMYGGMNDTYPSSLQPNVFQQLTPFNYYEKPTQPSNWYELPPSTVKQQQYNGQYQAPQQYEAPINEYESVESNHLLTLFSDDKGQFDFDKMLATVGQMATIYHQVSPIVKQFGSFIKGLNKGSS